MGSEIWAPNHLKLGQKYSDLEWSGFQMVRTIAVLVDTARPYNIGEFEIQSSKGTDFKLLDFRSPLYSLCYGAT